MSWGRSEVRVISSLQETNGNELGKKKYVLQFPEVMRSNFVI
jgi:hypothetical protein